MLSVPAPLRKEHPSLLLERGGPGMQQCLIGQRDLWSLRVAIPTCLWFPANRGVKCRVELAARGGPGARGNPGLCQPGRRPSASPGELAGTAGLPSPEHPPAATPPLSLQLCCTEGAGGLARHGGRLARAPRSFSELAGSFCEPKPQEGYRRRLPRPLWIDRRQPAQEHPSTKLPSWLPAAWERGLAAAALPGAACALSAGLDLPPMPTGSLRARKALSSPGHRLLLGGAGGLFAGREGGATGSLPSAVSWSHEPLPAALQEAAGPGDPLLLPVCHRDPLPR